jgi:hypothetical protein
MLRPRWELARIAHRMTARECAEAISLGVRMHDGLAKVPSRLHAQRHRDVPGADMMCESCCTEQFPTRTEFSINTSHLYSTPSSDGSPYFIVPIRSLGVCGSFGGIIRATNYSDQQANQRVNETRLNSCNYIVSSGSD